MLRPWTPLIHHVPFSPSHVPCALVLLLSLIKPLCAVCLSHLSCTFIPSLIWLCLNPLLSNFCLLFCSHTCCVSVLSLIPRVCWSSHLLLLCTHPICTSLSFLLYLITFSSLTTIFYSLIHILCISIHGTWAPCSSALYLVLSLINFIFPL